MNTVRIGMPCMPMHIRIRKMIPVPIQQDPDQDRRHCLTDKKNIDFEHASIFENPVVIIVG